jgi:hypothetical protein
LFDRRLQNKLISIFTGSLYDERVVNTLGVKINFLGAPDGTFIPVYSDHSSFKLKGVYSITDHQAASSNQSEIYVAINYDVQNNTPHIEEEIE